MPFLCFYVSTFWRISFLKVKKGLFLGRNTRHRRKWEAGVTQFILKNWIMHDFKLVSTVTEVNGTMCMLKCKHRCNFFPGLVPWYVVTYEHVQLQVESFGVFFLLLFNVKLSVVIAREQIFLCRLSTWELESVDREPDVQLVWGVSK